MKKPKMYIPVIEPGKSVSLVCANKVTGLEDHLPTQEMLNIHMEQQKIMIQKDKDYKVHPLYLFVEKEEMMDMWCRKHHLIPIYTHQEEPILNKMVVEAFLEAFNYKVDKDYEN